MTLVELEGRNGQPIWINPEHVVSITSNYESNTFVGQPHTACTEVQLGRISWIVRGEPQDVIDQLFNGKRSYTRKQAIRAGSVAGSD